MSFLRWLVRQGAAPFVSAAFAARSLWDALKAMWDTILRVFRSAVSAGVWLAQHAAALAIAVLRYITSLGVLLIWLATTLIPAMAQWAINGAITWAARELKAVKDWAWRTIKAVESALRTAVNWVKARAEAILRWAKDQIDKLWSMLRWTYNLVRNLLTDAEKLAVWLLPKLLKPLLRFMVSKSVAIGIWLLRRSVSAVPAMAGLIESVIARVL